MRSAPRTCFGWLNLLSGRWALQLLQGTPTQIKERLATVIAFRLLADRERIFEGSDSVCAVVSLDELLRVTGKEGLSTSEGWAADFFHKGVASDDLLLLRCLCREKGGSGCMRRVIEVKYSESVPPVEKAYAQVVATQKLLNHMFATGGAGRSFRARVLAKLVKSYVSRLAAYQHLPSDIASDPRYIQALNAVGSGDFDFIAAFHRDGYMLVGDFISVEPTNRTALHQPQPSRAKAARGSAGYELAARSSKP